MSLVIAIPPPSSFVKNDLLITNVFEQQLKFKNGAYLASSSSSESNRTLPFNAFNGNNNRPWVSGKEGVSDYLQNPYNGGDPSTFVGGGKITNTWNTIADNKDIQGEWIQIELPYKIFLSKYTFLTANSSEYYNGKNYPKLFYLLGSNDGVRFFNLDQQHLTEMPSNLDIPSEYNLNANKSYNIFRLVINQIFSGSYVSIAQLNIMGYQNIVVNQEAFTGLNYSSYQPVISPINVVPSKTKRIENNNFQAYAQYDILTEEFDNHGYVVGNVSNINISDKKIIPLKQIYNDLSGSEINMSTQFRNLGNTITSYQNSRNQITNDSNYEFINNELLINNRKLTVQDGLQEDANALVFQQNNIYILGTITVGFMIVGAFMLAR